MSIRRHLPVLVLKNIKTAKGKNFTGNKYRPVDANISPELKDLLKVGNQMVKQFHIKPEHLRESLKELRKAK